MAGVNSSVDKESLSVEMINAYHISSQTQCLAIMQDHTPFDVKIGQEQSHFLPMTDCMHQIFTLRDKLQLTLRILKHEPQKKGSDPDNIEKSAQQLQVWQAVFSELESQN